jgi:uncharacterized protein YbbK (DUF523 family)
MIVSVDDRPRIGISSCLLGEAVRFDAGHKRDPFLVETFGAHVEWVPVCPELEAGFGVPRPAMRLVADGGDARTPGEHYRSDQTRLIVIESGDDVTAKLQRYSAKKAERLADAGLSGYVLKKDSPSCGMERVKVYGGAVPQRAGRGRFSAARMGRLPTLPVGVQGRLSDPPLGV